MSSQSARRGDESILHASPPPTEATGSRLNRRLLVAVAISAAVHLSAVTIFNVVIYFPISEIKYFEFRFVEAPRGSMGAEEPGLLALSTPAKWEWLPQIQPPSLDQLNAGRLSLSNAVLPEQSLAQEIYGSESPEMSVLGAAFDNVQRSVRRLTLEADSLRLDSTPPVNVQRFTPTAGFSGELRWSQREDVRGLLFSPPLQSLWSLPADVIRGGLTYTLTVDPSGRVTRVWNEDLRSGEQLAAVESQLLQYRFAPDATGSLLDESVSLILKEAEEGL